MRIGRVLKRVLKREVEHDRLEALIGRDDAALHIDLTASHVRVSIISGDGVPWLRFRREDGGRCFGMTIVEPDLPVFTEWLYTHFPPPAPKRGAKKARA